MSSSLSLQFVKFIETKFLLFWIFSNELDKYEIILKLYSEILISINSFVGKEKYGIKEFTPSFFAKQLIKDNFFIFEGLKLRLNQVFY